MSSPSAPGHASNDSGRLIVWLSIPASGVPAGSGSLYSTSAAPGSILIRFMNLSKTAPPSGACSDAMSHAGTDAALRQISSAASVTSCPASSSAPTTAALNAFSVALVMITLITWLITSLFRSSARRAGAGQDSVLSALSVLARAGVYRLRRIPQVQGAAALAALQKIVQGEALGDGVGRHVGFLLVQGNIGGLGVTLLSKTNGASGPPVTVLKLTQMELDMSSQKNDDGGWDPGPIYSRVSSEGQEPQPSIEEQLEAAQSNAEELGLKIVTVYIDEGSSGSDPERRAAFQALLR